MSATAVLVSTDDVVTASLDFVVASGPPAPTDAVLSEDGRFVLTALDDFVIHGGSIPDPPDPPDGAVIAADLAYVLNDLYDYLVTAAYEPPPPVWEDLGQNATINAVSTTDGKKIGALIEFGGRIYLGYGDYDLNQPTAIYAIAWNPATSSFVQSENTLNSNANMDLRVIDDELWMVVNDAASGTHMEYGVVDASHAFTVVNSGSAISGWHLFDSIFFGSAPFISGAAYDGSQCSKGAVWRHNGTSWAKVLEITPSGCNGGGYRIYGMFAIGSTLYAKPRGLTALRTTTNGTSWSTGPTISTDILVHPIPVDGGVIYKTTHFPGGVATALRRFTGSAESTIISSGVKSHCIDPDGIPWVRVGTEIREGNAAGTSFSMVDDEAPSNGSALCVTADAFYVGTADSHLWRLYR